MNFILYNKLKKILEKLNGINGFTNIIKENKKLKKELKDLTINYLQLKKKLILTSKENDFNVLPSIKEYKLPYCSGEEAPIFVVAQRVPCPNPRLTYVIPLVLVYALNINSTLNLGTTIIASSFVFLVSFICPLSIIPGSIIALVNKKKQDIKNKNIIITKIEINKALYSLKCYIYLIINNYFFIYLYIKRNKKN